ncbi:MAG: conjugal transfer protein TraF [Bacilli bacterium]|nr:conjugal transfer protein TraF [Bacilli bacterium]
MTKGLLIVTLIMILIIVLCPIITTLLVSKNEKNKEVFNKILKITSVVNLIVLIILISLWIDPIKNNNLTIKESSNNTEETNNGDELSNAGFKELTIDKYLELIESSEKNIILVARPTCGYCQKFTPVLKEAAESMNLTINYVNTDNFSEDDWTKFNSSLSYLNSEQWGTPLTLIVQNGEVVAENNGYVELDAIKKFFTDNGFGK